MVTIYKQDPYAPFAYDDVFKKVSDIVTIKYRQYTKEIDDLIQEVHMRVFRKWNSIASEPIKFFSNDGRNLTEDDLGRCFRNYVMRITVNALNEIYRKNVPEPMDYDGLFGRLVDNESSFADKIAKMEEDISIYRLCLKFLFELGSKPYILLGFCFNALIHFDESDHKIRGHSSYTAEVIENKTLGSLRHKFSDYHEEYLRPIPKEILTPLDTKLSEVFEKATYEMHTAGMFYGPNPAKTISDWTSNTKRLLMPKLLKETYIKEFVEMEEYKSGK